MGDQTHVFRRIACRLALVRLRTRVCRCPTADFPLVWPIAVVIATDARVSADALTVLPPQPVGCLRIDESYILVNIIAYALLHGMHDIHAPSGLTIGMI